MIVRKVSVSGRRCAAVAVAVGFVVTVGACDSGTASPPPAPERPDAPQRPPASTSAASPAEKAERDALAAYRGMWRDFVVAGRTSDWRSPALGRHATGLALTNLSRGLYADNYNGLVTKGEPLLDPELSSVKPQDDPTKVVITDCGDSTKWLKYRKDNGKLANDEPGGRRLINAIVRKQVDGSWKVSEYGVQGLGSC